MMSKVLCALLCVSVAMCNGADTASGECKLLAEGALVMAALAEEKSVTTPRSQEKEKQKISPRVWMRVPGPNGVIVWYQDPSAKN